jgi:hypothetical protein
MQKEVRARDKGRCHQREMVFKTHELNETL